MPNILPPKPGKHGNHCPTCICGTLPNRDFPTHSYLRPNLAPACNQSLKWRQSGERSEPTSPRAHPKKTSLPKTDFGDPLHLWHRSYNETEKGHGLNLRQPPSQNARNLQTKG